MFNLRRAKAQFVSQFQPEITVQMIHDDFDSAVDELINKALDLDANKKEKHERLRKLGFRQIEEMREIQPIIDAANLRDHLSEFVNKYKASYPGYKFITSELVEKICKKYGLAKAEVCYYKGSIPDKNLEEIEAFSLKDEDRDPQLARYGDDGLRICAPIKDFDTKHLKLEGTNLVPKDPIVLKPVNNGFLILSKWGLEANDQDLINETDN